MKVKCNRDQTVFEVEPREYPAPGMSLSMEECREEGYAYPTKCIDCPTCHRGYFLYIDGIWRSDRELITL